MKILRQLGIIHENTKVAGISSGALTAGAICSGLSEDRFHKTVRVCCGGAEVPGRALWGCFTWGELA